jgi:nucleoside-diphosphate-sugar epimerase
VRAVVADPYDEVSFGEALGDATFDLAVVSYGRLRMIAAALAGRVARFVSAGGFPVYQGYRSPRGAGMVPGTAEDSAQVDEREDPKGHRMVSTEAAVFLNHPGGTHLRYPIVYGPGQPLPREWSVVRRALDGRRRLILPDGGLSLQTLGYAENVARAVLLVIDRHQRSAGRIFNVGDESPITLRRWVELVASAVGHEFEMVSMPAALAVPARPMLLALDSGHRYITTSRLRDELGYVDAVPADQALTATARWLEQHRPEPGGLEERILQDPFDYAAEDRLLERWDRVVADIGEMSYDPEPGPTMGFDLTR